MIWACALILAGGYAAQHSRLLLSSDICLLSLVASLLMLACRRTRQVGYLVFGFSWFLLAGVQIVDSRLQPRYAGDSLLADVRIVDFPRKTDKSLVFTVEPVNDPRLPPRSRVSWFDPSERPAIGDIWRLELRLKRPRGLSNPGVFDREAWLFRNEVHATGYIVGGERNRRLRAGTESIVDAIRHRFVIRSAAAAPSPEIASVLAAIGVGARHDISRQQWDRYAITGSSHLMAISGLHIGLAASAAFLLARVLTSFLPPAANAHVVSILAALICASAYAIVSGLGVPAQRAMLMLLVAAISILRRRSISPPETIAISACVVFVVNPVATMAPGFHLSFAAVALLIWLACIRTGRSGRLGLFARVGGRIRQLLAVQVFLLFGLMPLTVLLFQRIALLSVPANLIAVPLFSFVTVPLTLLGLALGLDFGVAASPESARSFDAAADGALRMAAVSIVTIETFITWIVKLPLTDVTVIGLHGYKLLVVVLPLTFALLPRGWPGRYVAIIAVAVLLVPQPARPPAGCADTHVLDVGQGLAIVLQTHRHTLMFDTGASFRGGGSMADQVIVPFLTSLGLRRIDWLIVSHADIDHSGGVAALAGYAEIGQLLAGEPLPAVVPAAALCASGQSWNTDGLKIRVLYPDAASPRDGNDSSCVVLIEAGPHGILLTGDIEAGAERAIIAGRTWGDIDAVVVPHHGSLTSSSTSFVNAVAAELAIVSSGFDNRWGFPKDAVTARWEAAGAIVLNTATSGAVSFRLCSDSGLGALKEERRNRTRFWREDGY